MTIKDKSTLGQHLAEMVASFGGSWTFILIFAGVLIVWVSVNSVAIFVKPFGRDFWQNSSKSKQTCWRNSNTRDPPCN